MNRDQKRSFAEFRQSVDISTMLQKPRKKKFHSILIKTSETPITKKGSENEKFLTFLEPQLKLNSMKESLELHSLITKINEMA